MILSYLTSRCSEGATLAYIPNYFLKYCDDYLTFWAKNSNFDIIFLIFLKITNNSENSVKFQCFIYKFQ